MKMPLFIKKSVYAKMPMFFGGGDIGGIDKPKIFQPAQPFKSAFEDPELLATPDVKLPEKPSWMDTYQPKDDISAPIGYGIHNRIMNDKGNISAKPLDKPKPEVEESNTMGALRDGMYVGNALLRGLSEGNANRQMEQYEQMNIANPLANMAYNDGRSEDVTYGYEQFMKGGFYKKMGKKRNC